MEISVIFAIDNKNRKWKHEKIKQTGPKIFIVQLKYKTLVIQNLALFLKLNSCAF